MLKAAEAVFSRFEDDHRSRIHGALLPARPLSASFIGMSEQ
jgi:hypothetical protein